MERRVLVRKKQNNPIPKQPEPLIDPIEKTLTGFDLGEGQKLSREEVKSLQNLHFPDKSPILSLDNPFVIIDVLNLLRNLSFENVINYLETALNARDLTLNSPLLESEHERVQIEIDNLQTTIEVEEGAEPCPNKDCVKVEVGKHRTLSFQKQVRSADEPMTTFVRCLDCGQRWRID